MTVAEIEETFEKSVLELPFSHQVAYVWTIGKRHFADYVRFSTQENFGNPAILEESLNLLQKIALNATLKLNFETSKIESQIQKLEAITPDTEDFDGIEVSLALDACVILLESLSAILENDQNRLASVAYIPFSSADMKQENGLTSSDLMTYEAEFYTELLEKLRSLEVMSGFFE